MLDERKASILRALVRSFIETGQPVGSSAVARAAGLAVSPATIRNEMAALEQEGFLHQPHTSAGRVPTDKGYRFFVDSLAGPGPLAEPKAAEVRTFFDTAHGAIERMLQDTTSLLSRLTDYAAVVVGPAVEQATIRSVQVVGLSRHVLLVVAVLSNASVERWTLESTDEVGDEKIAAASVHLAAHLVGHTLHEVPDVPPCGDRDVDEVVRAALGSMAPAPSRDAEQMFVGGVSRITAAFDAVDTVRRILTTLEEQYVVVGLLRDVLSRGLSVAIGHEHGVEPLASCSIVVAPYEVDGEAIGTISVLGPTRMNYPQALAAVAVVSDRLGRRLAEG